MTNDMSDQYGENNTVSYANTNTGNAHEAIRTKFKIHLQNSKFQASDDFKSDDSKTFLRQDIAKRFPDS